MVVLFCEGLIEIVIVDEFIFKLYVEMIIIFMECFGVKVEKADDF